MPLVELRTTARLLLPPPIQPEADSLYVFNLYRAGSSVTEAVAMQLADMTRRVPVSPQGLLWDLGATIINPKNTSRSALFLDDEGVDLIRLCERSGYMFMGFREVPIDFARRFDRVSHACLVVRDLRDIGISHYKAAQNHVAPDNAAGRDVRVLRELTSAVELEAYLLMEGTIDFLSRISECYRPLIERGTPILRYEDFEGDGGFDLRAFSEALLNAYSEHLPENFDRAQFYERVARVVAESPSLRNHATSGRSRQYEHLRPEILSRYTEALRPGLDLFGYP